MSAVTQAENATKTKVTTVSALNLALRHSMLADDKVMLMGEDIGPLGGVFRVTEGLQDQFGEQRVFDTPLAESGIIGTAIGLALRGYRPVCEIQFDGFVFPGYDQITTQLAKLQYRSQGRLNMPVVVRIPYGGGIGAIEHHSESPEVLFAHTPGLRVVNPGSPVDAYWMLRQAIASNDPVIFFEPKRRYWERGELEFGDEVPELFSAPAPFAGARIIESGSDVTLAAYGPTVATAQDVAATLRDEGRSAEVIDLRSVSPMDVDTVVESVQRTGRLVIAHEAPTFLGSGAELAAAVTERCFYSLEAPVMRVGGFHTPYPPASVEEHYLPNLDRILDAVDRAFAF